MRGKCWSEGEERERWKRERGREGAGERKGAGGSEGREGVRR